jgi:diguanylate cyclase (GGDEF)-like protein
MRQEQRFQDPLFIDSLTGLFNRYFLYQALPELIRQSEASGSSLGMLMFDIDNFKNINDTYGHLKGDHALKEAARVLKACIREEDEAVRYAGDEFIVIFKAREAAPSFFEVGASRIIEEISKIVILSEDEVKFSLSASGGLAIYPGDGKDLEKLIDAADKALYLSKERGKDIREDDGWQGLLCLSQRQIRGG